MLPGLKQARERNLTTQRELAERSGIAQATIARLETQRHSAQFRTVRKLAEALGVEPQQLMESEAPPVVAPSTDETN
jgi:transcriptional regulator with XRE-family HTH domain